MSNPYTIEKMQVAAEIHLPNQSPESMRIFLDPNPINNTGFERPSSLLEGPDEFAPMLNDADEIVFVRRESIVAMTVATELEVDLQEELQEGFAADQAQSADIEVVLEDGTALSGEVRYILPEANCRLQDFIDIDAPTLTLRRGEKVTVVNKSKIIKVKPIREKEGAR